MKRLKTLYKHGGGYKKASLLEGLDWQQVADYSTSINWMATEFYPENLSYNHFENIEYPDPDYTELREIIEKIHGYNQEHFLMTHGANEAISYLFYTLMLQGYKDKTVALVGPTYSEYNKCCDLNGFKSVKVTYNEMDGLKDCIVVVVNPNTPYGVYYDLKDRIISLMEKGCTVVFDESFIDFTEKPSMYGLVKDNPNLYLIHSMTKFYGSAGARLGVILSSNALLQDFMSVLLPPWTISAYDSWFYRQIIPQYKEIKATTVEWISAINNKADEVIKKSSNIRIMADSLTCYRTLEVSEDYLKAKNIQDFRKFFLNEYKIYVRPTADFFGCSKNSFRVGLRRSIENEQLWRAIEDIG